MYKLGAMFTTARFVLTDRLEAGKQRVRNFMQEEVGGTEIIAVIIILVVVIALGLVFKDNIIEMANNIWDKIGGGSGNGGNSVKPSKKITDPFN